MTSSAPESETRPAREDSHDGGTGRPRRRRRTVEIAEPRLSVLHVLDRVRIRMIDIQVWDVAGTMTFYTLLSLFPAAIAAVSMVSMLGLADETVATFGELIVEIFPSVDPTPYLQGLLTITRAQGGMLGLVLGTLGALLSASNGVAAFHRALHRVYDTREGRPFLWFRTIVFAETVVITAIVLLMIGMMALGSEFSQRIGEVIGIPRIAFETWNVAKWPLLLVLLIIVVSLAYYLFPNVRLPRYRLMTLGSAISVSVLFASAVLLGRLASSLTRVTEVLTALNGLTGILLLLWLANIVIVAGAALDAEFLRARQIAAGLEAWDHIALASQATHSMDFLARDAANAAERSRIVAASAHSGEPARLPRSLWVVGRRNPLAVNPPDVPADALATGTIPLINLPERTAPGTDAIPPASDATPESASTSSEGESRP